MPRIATPPARSGRAIYARLKAQIADGSLAAGAALPSTRGLATELGVSRGTVSSVYEQLVAEGYLETSQGARTRVARGVAAQSPGRAPATAPAMAPALRRCDLSAAGRRVNDMALPAHPALAPGRPAIEFLYGALSPADFPVLAWRKTYNRILVQRQQHLYYAAPEGEPELRAALQAYLRRARGLACEVEQILVVHGSQQAIDLATRLLVDPGDRVLIENPGYPMARHVFAAAGAELVLAPVDEQGLLTAALPARGARLAYVTPSHQFPLGGVLPAGRRRELLGWARQHGSWIVEDDYDGEFRYGLHPVDALQAMDETGRVIYVGTFSKALSPQMRLGYMVVPRALVHAFRQMKRLADRHAPVLEQLTLAALIGDGVYERHVRRVRREHEKRRAALLDAIEKYLPGGARVEGAASGLHVVAWLPKVAAAHEAALVALLRQQGVGVWPISPMFANAPARARPCAGIILGYASLTPKQIDKGVRLIAAGIAGARFAR